MKKFIILLAIVLPFIACGCFQQPPQQLPQQQFAPAPQPPAPAPIPIPIPVPVPQPPIVMSPMYRSGYWDGYFGRYISWRWMAFDYREGWNLGKFDRQHNINRFPNQH